MNGDEFLQFKFDAFKAGDATVPDPTVTSLLDMVEEQNYIAGNEVNWLDECREPEFRTIWEWKFQVDLLRAIST